MGEPTAGSYIELGILAGDPLCWYFWDRAGLRNEEFIRVMPKLKKSMRRTNVINFQIANAGGGHKRSKIAQLVAVPLVKVVAASHGENGDSVPTLHDAPVEGMNKPIPVSLTVRKSPPQGCNHRSCNNLRTSKG